MRNVGKVLCFFFMMSLALGQIYSLVDVSFEQRSISVCSTDQECQDQYVLNLLRCFPYSDATHQTNICGQDIDLAYVAVTADWPEKRQKFFDIAEEEQQRLAPDVLQAKQERIRNIIKEHYHITKSKFNIALALFVLGLIVPIISLVVDWLLDRKASKIKFHGGAPSTQIMLLLVLFLGSLLHTTVTGLGAADSLGWGMGIVLVLVLLTASTLLALVIFREARRVHDFIRAVKQARGAVK